MKTKYILTIIILLLGMTNTFATSYIWVGNTSTSWNVSSNWNPSTGVPDSVDNVTISTGTYNLVLDQNRKVTNLTLSSKTIDLSTYTLTVYGTATMTSGTVTNGTFKCRGTLAAFNGTLMDCPVDAVCGYIRLTGSTFNEIADFTDLGTATGTGSGGCTFNDDVTITHSGTLTYFTLANTTGDVFNADVTFVNSSNRELYVSTNGSSTFNGNIICNSTSTGGILFGNLGGTSTLASGKTISIGGSGFSADYLTLKNFTQSGSTAQTLTLTGTAIVNMISCAFNGNLTVTAPGFLLKNSTFNGTATLTRNGSSGNHQSDGGNLFNNSLTIDNSGSSGRIRMASTTADTYNGSSTTFSSSGGQDVQIAYSGNNIFEGNLTINSNKVVFNTSNGKVTFSGGNSQSLNGSYNYPFKKLAINKSANHVTANTTLSVDDTLFFISKNLITTSTNLLTMKHGSTVSGASNSSFVSGPVKKVGNTAFAFPVGKGIDLGQVEITAPSNTTDAFIAEYFNTTQNAGVYADSSIRSITQKNYWNFIKTNGNSTVKVNFSWNDTLVGLKIDSNSLFKLAYWDDSLWTAIPIDSMYKTNNINFISSNNPISNFGNFVIANAGTGKHHTVTILENGRVQTWGDAGDWTLGGCNFQNSIPYLLLNNNASLSTFCNGFPNLPELQNVIQVSAGSSHSLGVLCDGSVVGWGSNVNLQLGNLAPFINPATAWTAKSLSAVPVLDGPSPSSPPLINIKRVSAGGHGSIAVSENGSVYTWGASINDLVNNSIISPVGGISNPELLQYQNTSIIDSVTNISAGGYHYLALQSDGRVLAWGRNGDGQLGIGSTIGNVHPRHVMINSSSFLTDIVAIAAGAWHSMALDRSGRVYAWGHNEHGELGDGLAPLNQVYAKLITGLTNIIDISAGTHHSLCVDAGGIVYGWGYNFYNQVGLTSGGANEIVPIISTLPIGAQGIYKILAGEFHSIALGNDGKVYGWGDGFFRQLGSWHRDCFDSQIPQYSSPPIELTDQSLCAFSASLYTPFVPCDRNISYCYYNYEVSGNENWTSISSPVCFGGTIIFIKDEIFIPKGSSLELDDITLEFGPNGRIILEEGDGIDDGAQLILNNGSTLTAAGDCMWKGIEVRGNSSVNSSDSRQAKVIVNSGAVIEHAHNAITLGKWDEGYYACYESPPIVDPSGFDLTGSGGQIECDDATFQNNATDIRFAPYTRLSASTIENSHFLGGQLRDNRYGPTSTLPFNIFYARKNNSQRAVYGIRQWQNFIVEIEGNEFEDYEEAIFLTASRLRIIGNDFTNCRMGINSISTVSVLIYGGQVEANTFNNIRIHINAGGGRYLNISDQNEFNPNAASQASNLCAINLNNETAFDIVDNNFTSLRFGIVANNSGVSGGLIRYRLGPDGNLFTDCWRSIQMQGNNGNLRIKCNTYNNDAGGTNYNTNWFLQNGGLLANQGFFSSVSQTTQAGNWFEQELIRNELSSFSTNPFTYFRHGAGSPDEVIPATAGPGTINIDATSIAMSTFDDACDPIIIPTNGEPDRLAFYENAIDSLNLELNTLVGSIDNQFTDSLVAIIDNFYPQDTILDRLRFNGPLSDTVLIKAINTVDALDDYAVYEVLFVNSPYSEEVLNALNGRDPEIDEGMRDALNLVQGINPPYITITSLNKEIDYYKGDKRLLINSYVTRLSSQDSVQKAIQVLEAENSYEDRQTVYGTYITLGELDSAATKLELLITSGQAETDWLTLSEILLSLTSDGKTWFDMTEGEADVLREIATQEENTLAKIQSQNVLHLVYGDTFPVMIDDEEIYLRQMQKPKEDAKVALENDKFQLYPNPANDNVEIRLNNIKEFISHIVLINNLGNIVLNQKIGDKQSASQLNTSQLPSGLYLVKVNATSGTTYSNKLMIVK